MRRRGSRSGVLVGAGLAAIATSLAGALAAYADDAPGSGFGSYSMSANAPSLQFTEDNANATTHPEAEIDVPEALSTMDSGIGYALSSAAWPGSLAANLGTLLIVAGGSSVPPQATALNYPVRAEARNGDGTVTNASIPGATMTATVQPARTSATTQLEGAQQSAFAIGASSATSSTALDGASRAVASAETHLQDVSIAGVIHLASVSSTATTASDGSVATGSGGTTLGAMTIAGVPVSVDSGGLHVGPTSIGELGQPIAQAEALVQQALSGLGMTIAVTAPTSSASGGNAAYTAGSLVFVWTPPSPTAETVTLTLGGAATFARASKGIAFSVPGSAPPGQPHAPTHVAPTGQQQPGTVPPATAPGVVAVGAGGLPPASPASDALPAPAVAAAPGLAAVSSAAPSLPSLPTRLPAGWIVLAVVGAIACGLGVFYRLPLITSNDAGSGCPRGSQR